MKCRTCGYTWDTGKGDHDCMEIIVGERDSYRELLDLRDGGTHDADCKIHNPGVKQCNCWHDEVEKILENT